MTKLSKKLLALVLALSLCMSIGTTAFAAERQDSQGVLIQQSSDVIYDDGEITIARNVKVYKPLAQPLTDWTQVTGHNDYTFSNYSRTIMLVVNLDADFYYGEGKVYCTSYDSYYDVYNEEWFHDYEVTNRELYVNNQDNPTFVKATEPYKVTHGVNPYPATTTKVVNFSQYVSCTDNGSIGYN